jgi:hypothetical protein
MSIPVTSDLAFAAGATIQGLPPAVLPGQPLTYEQLSGGSPVESIAVDLPIQSQAWEQSFARPGTLASQNIRAWLAPTIDTDDNDLWQLEGVQINAMCQADAVLIILSCQYCESGNIKINYQVF